MPEVSIIVPNYNHASYLNQRIESILNQTYQDFEVILLDDCSIDQSRDILEQYRNHPKVSKIIYNEINSGSTFKQWKLGIDNSSGDYIWIAESDDWCEPNLLGTLMETLLNDCEITLGYVQSYYIENDNSIKWVSNQKEIIKIKDGSDFVKEYMLLGNSIFNASMAIFKKSAYQEISKEFLNYKFCGDWIFWTEIARQGRVFISGKILNYFRNHERDISSHEYNSGNSYVEELKVLFRFFDQNFMNETDLFNVLKRKYLIYCINKSKFSKEKNNEIEKLFFSTIQSKKYEQSFKKAYITNKFKSYIMSIIKHFQFWGKEFQ